LKRHERAWSEAVARFVLDGEAVAARMPFALPAPVHRSNVVVIPIAVLLGCSRYLEDRCREVASGARMLVRSYPIPFPPTRVKRLRPLVLVAPWKIYAAAPEEIEILAEGAGSALVLIENDGIARSMLEYRLMEALLFATRLRAQARPLELRSSAAPPG
jgi:hypothetical protein